MTPGESILVTRFVQAACPHQKIDEYTPDVWHKLMSDLNYSDVLDALTNLGNHLSFIGPPEIRAEVRRIRDERIRADMSDPAYDGADVLGGLAAIRAHRRAVGDGTVDPKVSSSSDAVRAGEVLKLAEATLAALPQVPRKSGARSVRSR